MKDIKNYINEVYTDSINKSVIIKELKRRLKKVEDPQNHNIYTNKLKEVYNSLINYIEKH